jgi:cytochrome c oxidase subunit 1
VSTAALAPRRTRVTLLERLTSTDHKRIGSATVVTALGFFFLAGMLALLMRSELAAPGQQVVGKDSYNQLFTMHGSTMFFLFASPVAVGIGLYLVPLQIGAADLIWPRVALFGYWLFLGSGIAMWSGFLTQQGAARAAWFAFYPLSGQNGTPGTGQDLWTLGVGLSQLGVMLMGLTLLATVVRRRAPGMTLLRMPFFTWSQVVTNFMVVVAFPSVVVAMALLYIDRNWFAIFQTKGGPITYQHLFWFYAHPLVYVVFFPLVGAVAEVIATFSRQRLFGYFLGVLGLIAFAALSTAVWGHHMFTTQAVSNRYFSFNSTVIAVPASMEYFAFIATMRGGRIRLASPMLFALGFMLLFLIGGLSGVFLGSPALDYHAHDSYILIAHFHFTLFGGTVFGLFAAIYFWFPKVTGRMLGEGLGRAQAILMFAGGLITFLPMFVLGQEGMPRQVADYAPFRGWETLNLISTIGSFTIFVGLVLFLINVVRSLRGGAPAGPDPWEGQSLEWITPSPPPRHNFDGLPPVTSYAPLMDLRWEGKDPQEEAAKAAVRPA